MLALPESSSHCLLWYAASTVLTLDEPIMVKLRFLRGYPSLMRWFGGISLPSGTKLPHRKLDTLGYHMVKTGVSISPGLDSVPGRDGRTDSIAIANTRSAVPAGTAVARKNNIKIRYNRRRGRSSSTSFSCRPHRASQTCSLADNLYFIAWVCNFACEIKQNKIVSHLFGVFYSIFFNARTGASALFERAGRERDWQTIVNPNIQLRSMPGVASTHPK